MSSKNKTTPTKGEARPAPVPKLRFPEFREGQAWRFTSLDSVCEILNNRRRPITANERTPGPYPYYGASGVVDYVGNFIFDERLLLVGEDGAKWGAFEKTAFIADGKYWVNNHAHVLKPFAANDTLLENYLTMQDLSPFVTGAAPPKLTLGKLKGIPIPLPAKAAEQQKIAECLSSVDELIAAHARKGNVLKTLKRGLMQQLFPREGETQPRLRFLEFRNTGEWAVRTLEDISPLQRGFDLPSQVIRPGLVPIVYSNGSKGFHAEGMAVGPGLVTGRSGTIGKLHFIESGSYWPHNTSLWVTSFKGHIPKFAYYLFDSIGFLRFASGSGVPTLNRNDAHSFETSVPPSPPEQQRIASCLSSLDALISAQTQKHEALKIHKRGLMQQLFPSPEEAEA